MLFSVLWFVLCSALIVSAWAAVLTKNLVHSIMYMMLVSISFSVLMLLMGMEFFAALSLIIYSGMTGLLLFFVHIFNLDKNPRKRERTKKFWWVTGALFMFLAGILTCICFSFKGQEVASIKTNASDFLHKMGLAIFGTYGYAFEICGTVLFVGIISSVLLMHKREANDVDK